MKRIWTFFLFLASTAVFLAACITSEAPRPTEPPTPAMATATTMAAAAATAVANEPTASAAAANDLSLIGQTGRPQFLNAYASW